MLLTRMIPMGLGDLRSQMDRMFEGWANPADGEFFQRPSTFPAVNVWEDVETLYAEAELPGVTMQDLEVTVVGDELSIKGTRTPRAEGTTNFHRQERGTGEFSRFVTLPAAVNADKVEAVLKNGILTITMPKAEEAKPKKIAVKTL